ncbi:MAG: cyclic nucleotide-binding domain-containing protein [Magnetococcales bacterium]|nr:cyclic nucleotide-binding domain-containing protein [Magnetococcales bacterium]
MMTIKQDKTENKALLDKFGFMKELDSKECEALVGLIDTYHAMDGEYLFEEGERDDEIFIIRKGNVIIGHRDVHHDVMDYGTFGSVDLDDIDDNDPHWVQKVTLGVGECFGEPDIDRKTPHQMAAMAVGEVELLCIEAKPLQEKMQKGSKACNCLGDALCRSVEKLLQHKYGK